MLITATCPNDVGETRALFNQNNNFLALFNEDLKVQPYSKVCVHSAYISFAPVITIEAGVNDEFSFCFETPSIPQVCSEVNLSTGQYTPQQLADALGVLINNDLDGNYDELTVHVDWDVISGTFQFHILFQQPSAGATTGIRAFSIRWGLNPVTLNLGRIMGFASNVSSVYPSTTFNRSVNMLINDTIPEVAMTIEGDYSLTYTTAKNATPVCYISIENINSKSWNNYSAQALKFLEVIRHTYPQNLNNAFILPYEKSWVHLDNDSEILLNSLEITLRNLDGTLMQDLDASKQVIIVFEVVPDLQRQREIEQIKSIQAQRAELEESMKFMSLLSA